MTHALNKLSSAVDQPNDSVKVRRGLWMLLTMSVVLGNILEFLLEVMVIVDVPDWGWCP